MNLVKVRLNVLQYNQILCVKNAVLQPVRLPIRMEPYQNAGNSFRGSLESYSYRISFSNSNAVALNLLTV